MIRLMRRSERSEIIIVRSRRLLFGGQRPAGFIDTVDRVKQEQILHVGVDLQRRIGIVGVKPSRYGERSRRDPIACPYKIMIGKLGNELFDDLQGSVSSQTVMVMERAC